MELLKLIKNRLTTEWKETFNNNVDILNRNARDQDQKLETTNSRIDNLVLHSGGDSPNEVVDARVNNKAVQFATLAARLLDTENTHDSDVEQLSLTQTDQQKQMEQLNNAIGIILGTYNSSINFYVSSSRGNDQTGDGTQTSPFKTIQMAANIIPLINASDVTIFIEAGVYLEDVVVNSVSGTKITIRPVDDYTIFDLTTQDLPVKVRSLKFTYCTGVFYVFGIQFVDSTNAPFQGNYKYSLMHMQGGYMDIRNCKFADNTKSLAMKACYAEGNTKSTISKCHFENQNIAIGVNFLADMLVYSATGSGNSTGFHAQSATIRGKNITGFATTATTVGVLGEIIMKDQVIS